ncbi:MAG: SDR family NAD(P)-dependent oxidoreductase, partial [Verrucomicrobiota bacterium]
VFLRWLPVNYAFHSHQMEPVREQLLKALGRVRVASPTIRLVSTVTGTAAGTEDFQAEYWWRNVRQPVCFAKAIQGLLAGGFRTFLEIGPHPVLAAAIRECGGAVVLPSLRRGKAERLSLLGSLGALYTAGSEVRWRTLYPLARRVRLPTYAWQLERHWHEAAAWARARLHVPDHPLLATRANASVPAWHGTLDLEKMPFLADHQVNGQILFPAAGFLDAALAVASAPWSKTLTDIDIRAALTLDRGPLRFELAGSAENPGFRISTRPDRTDAPWTCHVTGRFVLPETGEPSGPIDPETIKARCTMEVPAEDVYEAFERGGLHFGLAFRGIERVWRRDGEALGRVALPAGLDGERHFFHPALLDSCLQVLSQALPGDARTRLFLPVHLDRIRCFRPPAGAVWSHAVLVRQDDRMLTGDIRILDEEGNLLADLCGFQCLAVARGPDPLEESFYRLQWKTLPPEPALQPVGSREWIILADQAGLGEKLASELAAKGDCARCVYPASAGHRDQFEQILGETVGTLHGIIHLWNLDFAGKEPDAALLESAKSAGWFSLVALVQALGARAMEPRLLVVTRGAQAIRAGDSACVLQAGASGLIRVATNEYPQLQCRLIDLDPTDSGLKALLEEIGNTGSESEVAWRGGERHGARLVRSAFSQVLRDHCPPPDTDDFRMEFDRGREPVVARPVSRAAPGPGEVEIKVEAAGLNFRDLMKSLGIYPGENNDLPGDEFAGRISAIGEGVEGFVKGDAVLAMEPGSFRSRITLPAAQLFKVPPRMTCEEAATVPVAFVTAWYALHDLGRIQRGETILIHAAAGGVGLAAIQVALLAGATVFATAGSPRKREFLQSLGVKHVMDSRTLAFAEEVRTFTSGRGVDLVLNSLAGEAIGKGLGILAPGGRFLEIGKRDIYQNSRLELRPFRNNLSFFAIDLAQVAPERIRSLLAGIMERMESGALSPLPFRSFEMSRAEEAFQQMARALHIGKLVLRMEKVPPVPEPRLVVLRPDAAYLITGGLGGLGLTVAEWMIQNGARHLVLASRRGPQDPAAEEVSARLRAAGAEVLVLKADVSVAGELRRALETMGMPPIRGIFHSAMVIEDKTIAGIQPGSFQRVLAPKCDGAWNLHALGLPLDFFVMCSSVVSLLGSAGQGSYAAANSFLDSLADYRRSRGLPALTINWGLLGGIGYVSRNPVLKAGLESSGLTGLRPDEATSALGRLLGSTLSRAGIVKMNWDLVHTSSARFESLIRASPASREDSAFRARFDALPTDQRPEAMLCELKEQLAFVLRSLPSDLDVQSPLNALGL